MIFYYMKVYCVFTLESPHRGDSNDYTQYTIFQYENEKHPKLSQFCSYRLFSKGLKNEFERAVVNEPSVFEPLKFYCIHYCKIAITPFHHECFPCVLSYIKYSQACLKGSPKETHKNWLLRQVTP